MNKPILTALTFASALALSACGGEAAPDGQPDAGMYSQEIKVTELSFPGMDEAQQEQVRSQMEQASGNGQSFCMGEQEGAPEWKDAVEEMGKGMGGTCTEISREDSDTSIDLEMECQGAPQGDIKTKFIASATDESFTADVEFDINNEQFDQQARVAMTMTATRTGDCGA